MYRVLLVDDETGIVSALRRVLVSIPVEDLDGESPVIEGFTSAKEALGRASEMAFDLVVADYRMPEMSGVEFLSQLIKTQPDVARLILSAYADINAVISAVNEVHIFRFISKPWHDFELKSAVVQALAARALAVDNQRLADRLRVQEGRLSRREAELQRLERESPGITKLKRSSDGGIILDEDDY